MSIEESYRVMRDQLTNVRILTGADSNALTNLTVPALFKEDGARKLLEEVIASSDLFPLRESHRLMFGASAQLASELRHSNQLTAAVAAASFGTSVLQTAKHWEEDLLDWHKLLAEATATWDARWRESFRRLRIIEDFAVTVPKLAVEVWPAEIVAARIGLIDHSFKNISALQLIEDSVIASGPVGISTEPLTAAGRFVFGHGDVLRRMPPSLIFDQKEQFDRQQEEEPIVQSHRNEELGAKLEPLLAAVDGRLLDLKWQSWQKLSEGVAGARLAMLGLRELFSDLLRLLAPDCEIVHSPVWKNRSGDLPPNPTRAERIVFLLGPHAPELRAILQFEASIESSHKFAHTFADDPEMVRVHMAQLEIWIYLILLYSRKRN